MHLFSVDFGMNGKSFRRPLMLKFVLGLLLAYCSLHRDSVMNDWGAVDIEGQRASY
jgi:hypothetical protein